MGLPYENLTLQTSDGVKISAWFVSAKKAKGVILFCHGNAGNMSHRLGSIELFHKLGYSTLIFDYRGYGKSEGSPSEKGTYMDAQAAWDYLVDTRKVSPGNIIISGRSLGGAVAAALAKDNHPAALILESTFTSVPDLAAQLYPFLPARLICCFSYNTKARVAQVKCPVLVVHSRDDEMIHISHGRALFEAAKQPKRFLELAGGHNDSVNSSAAVYTKGLEAFLAEYVGEAGSMHEKP